MKTHILRFGGLALASLVLSLFPATAATPAASGTPGPIYNKQTGLAAGWTATTWGEIHAEPSRTVFKEGGAVSLQVLTGAGAVPYAGLQLVAGSSGVELDEQLRREGVVQLSLRNGSDAAGQPVHEQELQVMLSFVPAGGKPLVSQYERVVLAPAAGGSGWQTVTVSIPGMLRGRVDAATPVRLQGVFIQYIDQPQAGFYVGECVIRRTAK
ncbi:MAG: hypothetical protein K0R17_2948 [Rariglobus sp.]|jgi:hypothetical protein|nr:hypothetical protein [Rariglobus sp.]